MPKIGAKEIAESLMRDYPPGDPAPAEFLGGRKITGDIFYSTIQARIRTLYGKKYPVELFSDVCDILEAAGYWVHS